MIKGIGVDAVEIDRFAHWYYYSRKKLLRIFSEAEIDYCLSQKNKSAERFAVRFAAREAFFKALSTIYPQHSLPFLTICSLIMIEKRNNIPYLIFDWSSFEKLMIVPTIIHLSLTHTKTVAVAYVVIEDNDCS